VLVSSNSGLAGLLRESLVSDDASRFVVDASGDHTEDADEWSRKIEAVLRDRKSAFDRADELRRHLAREKTWAAAIAGLLAALGPELSGLVRDT
jgi:hypothetical protein